MPRIEVLAYMAGLIDGEGSVCLLRNGVGENRSPVVSISTTSEIFITFALKHFKGSKIKAVMKNKRWKQAWQWKLRGIPVLSLLESIYPFMLEPSKKRRAFLLINEYHKVTKRNGKYTTGELKAKKDFESRFLAS